MQIYSLILIICLLCNIQCAICMSLFIQCTLYSVQPSEYTVHLQSPFSEYHHLISPSLVRSHKQHLLQLLCLSWLFKLHLFICLYLFILIQLSSQSLYCCSCLARVYIAAVVQLQFILLQLSSQSLLQLSSQS